MMFASIVCGILFGFRPEGRISVERKSSVLPANINVNTSSFESTPKKDYTRLRNYLAQGNWKEADKETRRVMLAVAKREKEGWLDVEHIDNFPCADLRTIDQLWVKYSDGKFGFSIQKKIYQGLGGTKEYESDIWEKFGEKVGWSKESKSLYYEDITFDKKAPEGYLPYGSIFGLWGKRLEWAGITKSLLHVETCKL